MAFCLSKGDPWGAVEAQGPKGLKKTSNAKVKRAFKVFFKAFARPLKALQIKCLLKALQRTFKSFAKVF